MPERPASKSDRNVLPDLVASRLLARASELDMASGEGSTVSALRVAAAEAGISGSAFDKALAELERGGHVFAPDAGRRPRSPWTWAVVATAAVLLAVSVSVVTQTQKSTGKADAQPDPMAGVTTVSMATQAVVHSVGATPVTTEVRVHGHLFAALSVAPDAEGRRVGRVDLSEEAGGTATTPTALETSTKAGAITFSAPAKGPELELTVAGTPLRVRGHAVRLVRDQDGGPLRAEVVPPGK